MQKRFIFAAVLAASTIFYTQFSLPAQEKFELLEAFGLNEGQVISFDIDRTVGKRAQAEIAIRDVNYLLDVQPHSIRTGDFVLKVQQEDGSLVEVEPGPPRTVRGSLIGSPGSRVVGSILDKGLYAKIVMGDGQMYFIEPVSPKFANANALSHILYQPSDVKPHPGGCGVGNQQVRLSDVANHNVANKTERGSSFQPIAEQDTDEQEGQFPPGPSGLNFAEIGVDADYEFYLLWQSFGASALDIMELVITTMNDQFVNDVDIQHVISGAIVRTTPVNPYTSTDRGVLLNQFRDEWNNNQTDIRRDVAQLFTNKTIDIVFDNMGNPVNTVGLAWTASVCGTSAYSWVKSNYNGNFGCSTDLSAHELGHNWGAFTNNTDIPGDPGHCNCPNHTMNPNITCANDFHDTKTVPVIEAFRDSLDCLNDTHWVGDSDLWHSFNSWSILPFFTNELETVFDRTSNYEVWWEFVDYGIGLEFTDSSAGDLSMENGVVTFLSTDGGDYTHGVNGKIEIAPNATLNLAGGLDLFATDNAYIGRSAGSVATLNIGFGSGIQSAEATNNAGFIGFLQGSAGNVNVTGNGSNWFNNDGLFLGGSAANDGGIGELTLLDGGDVHVGDDPTNNAGSDLVVGDSGPDGVLVIRNGSMVNNFGESIIGWGPAYVGTASVLGGSTWTNDDRMFVGVQGSGTLNVESGSSVFSTEGFIGRSPGGSGTVTVSNDAQWRCSEELLLGGSLELDGGVGNLNLNSEGNVFVGNDIPSSAAISFLSISSSNSTANLVVRHGSTVSNDGQSQIGSNAGFSGEVLVHGSGSIWTNASNLNVGLFGTGVLNVQAGGTVSADGGRLGNGTGSTGTATVTGSGSRWDNTVGLFVGNGGIGTLNVDDSGVVTADIGGIGSSAGGSGTVTVINDAVWRCSEELILGGSLESDGGIGNLNLNSEGNVYIGDDLITAPGSVMVVSSSNSTANLVVRHGSTISNDGQSQIGSSADFSGEVLVHGSGSIWTNASNLNVGLFGTGVLNVQAGGTVSADGGRLGNGTGSTGTATVTGSGSRWNNTAGLFVGNGGTGTLNVDDSGVVTADIGGIGSSVGGSGTVTVSNDAQLICFDILSIGGTATQQGGEGTLNVDADGIVGVTAVTRVWPTGSLNLNAGALSSGSLTIEAGASVDIGIDGVGSGEFGQFVINGDLMLNGNLNVALAGGFMLDVSQQFMIADVGGTSTGQFDGLAEGGLVGNYNGVDLFITYMGGDGNDVVLYTTSDEIILGDVNQDGAVNLLDVDPFIAVLAAGTFQPEADCNDDGTVNLLDVDPFIAILAGG